jgi:hypothetical protein
MRIPNPTKLLPRPHHLLEVGRRAAGLLPGIPARNGESESEPVAPPRLKPLAPPNPSPVEIPKPKPTVKAKPSPRAKAKPKPTAKAKPRRKAKGKPKSAPAGTAAGGFPEPPGKDPGDISGDREPHHALNNPVGDPDPTAWPDPYDEASGTLDPHPAEDPDTQAVAEKLKREKLDD